MPAQCHCQQSGKRRSSKRWTDGLGRPTLPRRCRRPTTMVIPSPTSAPRLRTPRPHLPGTALTPPTSAEDCAHPAHICAGTALTAADWAGPPHRHQRRGGAERRRGSRTREVLLLCSDALPQQLAAARLLGRRLRRSAQTARIKRGAKRASHGAARLRRLRGRAMRDGRGKARGRRSAMTGLRSPAAVGAGSVCHAEPRGSADA